jgi:lipopolysaccharide transport system ATP-binding protein
MNLPMCSDIAISVKNLTKSYRIFRHPTDRIKHAITLGSKRFYREFTAMQNVSFEIQKGDTVGIIGRNGSGKSTLLQLICGILKPTSGDVQVNGRISALLELGSGFNPEFTGRENIYFQGAVVGISKEEMDDKFNDIAAFADIGEFIDQPVRIYSSGMFVRLAFAFVAHVDADILVIDEAFSVGDVFFTQKCMRFLKRFQKSGTILLVSHDQRSVIGLCEKTIWIEGGRCCMYGTAKTVCESYFASQYANPPFMQNDQANKISIANTSEQRRDMRADFVNCSNLRNDIEVFYFTENMLEFGTGGASIVAVQLLDQEQRELSWVVGGELVCIVVEAIANAPIRNAILGFFLKDKLGQVLFGDNTYLSNFTKPVSVANGEKIAATFEFYMPILPKGKYTIDVAVADGTHTSYTQLEWIYDTMSLESVSSSVSTGMIGIPFTRIELRKDAS